MESEEHAMALITCHHEKKADIRFQDGALPHVTGACSYQVVRASADPEWAADGTGNTYNHAAMLARWKGRFWYEYLSGPKGEHETPSEVYLCISEDGIHWEKPMELFSPARVCPDPYRGPKKELLADQTDENGTIPLVYHQRMGFYISSQDRLLAVSFLGICPVPSVAPNNGYGVGRVVREIYEDGSLSGIYFLRYNTPAGFNRENADCFPYYEEAQDEGFCQACRELLSEPIVTQQWWEEERLDTDFFPCGGGQALSWYTLPDKRIIGVFKNSLTTVSEDSGATWSKPEVSPTIITSTGKVWGQQLSDGTYALVYNPSPDGAHRWPLAITTGANGQDFYGLAAIMPEVPPCRYEGGMKNLGAQYMRGITENNRQSEDGALWIVCSTNKEDMWITRVPVPVTTGWNGEIHEEMSGLTDFELRNRWNLFVPSWGGAELETKDGTQSLHLWEQDPYTRVIAERNMEPAAVRTVTLRLEIGQITHDQAAVMIQSADGQTLISAVFLPDQTAAVRVGGLNLPLGMYETDCPLDLEIRTDTEYCRYEVTMRQNGNEFTKRGAIGAAVSTSDRLVIASRYSLPFQGLEDNGKYETIGNLPDADRPCGRNSLRIHSLHTEKEA